MSSKQLVLKNFWIRLVHAKDLKMSYILLVELVEAVVSVDLILSKLNSDRLTDRLLNGLVDVFRGDRSLLKYCERIILRVAVAVPR